MREKSSQRRDRKDTVVELVGKLHLPAKLPHIFRVRGAAWVNIYSAGGSRKDREREWERGFATYAGTYKGLGTSTTIHMKI